MIEINHYFNLLTTERALTAIAELEGGSVNKCVSAEPLSEKDLGRLQQLPLG